jgi:hypothetical protein
MIKWLKICALLLTLSLVIHSLEIAYDIFYHSSNDNIFTKHEPVKGRWQGNPKNPKKGSP